MGQIKEQAIKGTIYAYFGIAIGFVISAVLFPKYLTTEQIGLLGILVSYSMIFAQLGSLGINMVTIKYFPQFKDEKSHHRGFLPVIISISLLGFLGALAGYFIFRSYLIQDASSKSLLFQEYVSFLIPLIFITLFFNLFDNYLRALHITVTGTVMKEVVQRLGVILSLVLLITGIIQFKAFVAFYILSFAIPLVILFLVILFKGEFSVKIDKTFFTKELKRQMMSVAIFGIIGGFTGMVSSNLDRIMIERYLGLSDAGVYITVFYFATLISIPSRSLLKITAPHVSGALKEGDHEKLRDIYSKSALNQMIIGLFILVIIWANIESIMQFLPPEFYYGKYVILIGGLAFLSDMASGSANDIISNSRHYRVIAYMLIIYVSLVILSCIAFIPLFGITGAAVALLVSKLIIALGRYIFIRSRFGLNPYNIKFLLILGIGILVYVINLLMPSLGNLYLDVAIRSAVTAILFIFLVLISRVSVDINETTRHLWERAQRIFRR